MSDFSYNPIGNFQNVFNKNMTEINTNTKFLEGGIEKFEISPDMLSKDQELQNDLSQLQGVNPSETQCSSFSDAMKKSLNEITELDKQASAAKETFISGGDIDIHSVMIASQKANLSMQLAMQVRNKAIQAYNEIYRMSV